MRILHLIDPTAAGGGACTLRLVADVTSRLSEASHDVVVTGGDATHSLAGRCGLAPGGGIAGPYDLVHAWTPSAVTTAGQLARGVPVLAAALVGPVGGDVPRVFRRAKAVMAASETIRGELEHAGFPASRIVVTAPGIDSGSVAMDDRVLLRERWGVDETTFVVGLLCDPPEWSEIDAGIDVVGRAALTGRDFRLVTDHGSVRRSIRRRWLPNLGLPDLLIPDDEVALPWRVAPGLDAAIMPAIRLRKRPARRHGVARLFDRTSELFGAPALRPDPAILPLLWAMAARRPVIVADCPAFTEVIDDGRNGHVCKPGDPNDAAAHLLRLFDDGGAARRLGEAAAATIDERYTSAAFAERLFDQYQSRKSKVENRHSKAEEPKPTAPAAV